MPPQNTDLPTEFQAALQQARQLDSADSLRHCRSYFELPDDVIYLDGNSLGALPKSIAARLQTAVQHEWGQGLIRSWNDAGWYTGAKRVGALIAQIVGAQAHEVIACDNTSTNLFKVIAAACAALPDRHTLILEDGNFPTDTYVGEGVAELYGKRVVLATQDTIEQHIASAGSDLCAVQMTQVHYKTGRMLDMARITALAQAQGARMIWDLAHSAGAVEVQLNDCLADYAVGCGYKYLNGGPGAPAFVYVREDHLASLAQPLQGWFGHTAPFEFAPSFSAASGIDRLLVGTPSVLAMICLEQALQLFVSIDMQALRQKSLSLSTLFIALYDAHIAPINLGMGLATPREAGQRGSQVSFTHQEGYAIMQALIERSVIGDFRAPNILRFGFAPLYVSHEDCVRAIAALHDILITKTWQQPRYAQKRAVT